MKKKRWIILHEDEDLIIVDKPAPYLTIPDRYDQTIPSLVGKLSENRDQVFVNHRLDKETSGLILFTKNEGAHKKMSEAFESRTIEKYYYGLVHGAPPEEVGLIDLGISAAPGKRKGMIINENGKPSQTKYRVINQWSRYALIEAKLITGRQHQIRVHMRAIGCPLVSDKLYGDGNSFFLSDIKRKMNRSSEREEQPLLSRVGLHAHKLEFAHPTTGASLEFESKLPKDMKAVVHQLTKLG